jgi:hypothetical protein
MKPRICGATVSPELLEFGISLLLQNQSLSNNFPPQVFQPNSTMGPMTNTNIGNNGYGNEMDVTQLPGLESNILRWVRSWATILMTDRWWLLNTALRITVRKSMC